MQYGRNVQLYQLNPTAEQNLHNTVNINQFKLSLLNLFITHFSTKIKTDFLLMPVKSLNINSRYKFTHNCTYVNPAEANSLHSASTSQRSLRDYKKLLVFKLYIYTPRWLILLNYVQHRNVMLYAHSRTHWKVANLSNVSNTFYHKPQLKQKGYFFRTDKAKLHLPITCTVSSKFRSVGGVSPSRPPLHQPGSRTGYQ